MVYAQGNYGRRFKGEKPLCYPLVIKILTDVTQWVLQITTSVASLCCFLLSLSPYPFANVRLFRGDTGNGTTRPGRFQFEYLSVSPLRIFQFMPDIKFYMKTTKCNECISQLTGEQRDWYLCYQSFSVTELAL